VFLGVTVSQNGSFQRCGTAVPSLALENLQEVENLKLSGSEREKAEETIAGALGSIYVGESYVATTVLRSGKACFLQPAPTP
jgi:hypothetical protein